jgi:hypothetical protein
LGGGFCATTVHLLKRFCRCSCHMKSGAESVRFAGLRVDLFV